MFEVSSPLGPDWQSAGRLWWTSCGPPSPTDLENGWRRGNRWETEIDILLGGQSLQFSTVTTWWHCYTVLCLPTDNPYPLNPYTTANKLIYRSKYVIPSLLTSSILADCWLQKEGRLACCFSGLLTEIFRYYKIHFRQKNSVIMRTILPICLAQAQVVAPFHILDKIRWCLLRCHHNNHVRGSTGLNYAISHKKGRCLSSST